MSPELSAVAAFAIASVAAYLATPLAIRVALRTKFFDHPAGYKGHKQPTPYLGGAALVLAFLAGAVAMGGNVRHFAPILIGAVALAVVGTIYDRSFIAPMPEPAARALVDAFLGLARGLSLRTVAEGVETAEQLARAAALGCAFAQGYHIARPMPADELERWMSVWRRAPHLSPSTP